MEKITMGNYKQYDNETRVKVISTGEMGDAYEYVLDYISVFIDGENKISSCSEIRKVGCQDSDSSAVLLLR